MTFLNVVRTALSGISANKLRSGLTMLGIIIGVASVIATLALGNGARAAVENSFRFLGSDQIQVGAEFKMEDGESRPAGKLLTYEDGLTLTDAAPLIDRVEMTVRGSGKVRHGQTTLDMPFTGTDAGALTGKIAGGKVQPVGWPAGDMLTTEAFLDRGRFFTHSEVAAGAQVCVLGYKTADDLFLGDDPIGQTVWINRKPCEVIGVIAELETVDEQERTRSKPNEAFYLPVSTAVQNLFENEPWVEITAHVTDEARMEEAKAQIAAHLRMRHGIEQGDDGKWLDDFRLTTKKDILGVQQDGGAHLRCAAGGVGGRVAGRRRLRHHERDAGQRHRADAGDRRPHGSGRAAAGCGAAIPAGGRAAQPGRRLVGNPGRHPGHPSGCLAERRAGPARSGQHPRGLGCGPGDGHHLWAVSRIAGSASRPDRGATI